MEINNTPEMFLRQIINSSKIKKIIFIIIITGIFICLLFMLSPVQKVIFSFIDKNISSRGSGGDFEDRLISLLSLPLAGLFICIFLFFCFYAKNIAVFFENVKNDKLITIISIIFVIFLLCFNSIYSYKNGWQWLDSDHSSEMVLAEFLSQEKVFVSSNWLYSTEFRLIYQTLFSMPFFLLLGNLGNWALIRALVILCNNIVLILSYSFLMKQMKTQTKWIAITSLFLLIPLSVEYWNIIIFGGFYSLFITQLFVIIGLFIRLIDYTDTMKLPIISFIFFTLMSFLLGIQGIRAMLSVFIPLLITCIYLWHKPLQKKIFPLFLGFYSFIICCFGFILNYLLLFIFKFHSFDRMRFIDLTNNFFPRLGQCFISLAGFFGFSGGHFSTHGFSELNIDKSLLSVSGFFSITAVIVTVILFFAVIKTCKRTKTIEIKYITVFFIVSVIFNIFIFIIVDEYIKLRYFFPFLIFYIPFTAILFNQINTFNYLKRIAIISGIILFIFGQGYVQLQSISGHNINEKRKSYIQYLVDNKLNFGFSTYWNANVTTELSNGKINMTGLVFENNNFSVFNWLMPLKFRDPSYHTEESFLLLTRDEWEQAQISEVFFAKQIPDYQDNDFIILRYESAKDIHNYVLE